MPNYPMPSGPLSSDPMPSNPLTGHPMPSDPMPSDPLPSDPMTGYSISSDSLPVDPIPNDPMAGQPAPSDPEASGSVTPESVEPESVAVDSPVSANSPVDEAAIKVAEAVSNEAGPASEEIAIPIPALPQNPDPAPAQAIDLRQIADQMPPPLAPDLPALAEPSPPLQSQIPIATAAPLVATAEPKATKPKSATGAGSKSATTLPLQLLNQLLRKIGATPLGSLGDMLPLLRILTLAVLAGIGLRFATATLGAIDDLPLVGGLLELVGLVTLLNFLARNALKQQKRAELLARIQKLRTDLLG